MIASKKIVILIPTYNEAETICELIDKLAKCRNYSQYRFDLVVIDDNSPDKTADIVEEMRLSWVQLLRRPKKDGLGAAYRAGFLKVLGESQYSHVITMDADGSHRVEDLPALLMSMESSTSSKSLVIGTRWMPGGSVVNWPKSRQLLSKSGTKYARIALGIPLNDLTGGFRVYSSQLLEKLNLKDMTATGYCFQIEMARKVLAFDGKIKEVPITFVERKFDVSKMNMKIVVEAMVRVTLWGLRLIK